MIGENSVINQRCRLDARGFITIGENVSISPEVHIITADHDIATDDIGGRTRPVTIGDFVFVGSRADDPAGGVTLGKAPLWLRVRSSLNRSNPAISSLAFPPEKSERGLHNITIIQGSFDIFSKVASFTVDRISAS